MEIIVGSHEFLEVAGSGAFLLQRNCAVQLVHQGIDMLQPERLDDFQLQRLPQEVSLLRQSHIDPAHDRGMLREDVDQAFLLEPHQRVADRGRTDAELRGKCCARQGRSGRQFERDDHVAQPLEHLGCGLTVAIEPVGGMRAGWAGSDLR